MANFSFAQLAFSLLLMTLISFGAKSQGVDMTLVSGAEGADVVRAVIAKISFSNISFMSSSGEVAPFMRTMAYVETRDGQRVKQTGGGIWGISNGIFNDIMLKIRVNDSQLRLIVHELNGDHSNNHIGPIDWNSLVYSDMSIPLYSGLIARIQMHLNQGQLVGDFSLYWNFVFNGIRRESDLWEDSARNLSMIESCQVDTDLVFLLDESGSIRYNNFQEVKRFVYNFTTELFRNKTMDDQRSGSRLGLITFSSDVAEHISLNTSIERNQLLQQILQLPYRGGGTDTAAGLKVVRQQSWRDEISVIRLAIVVTDGKSRNFSATALEAQALHNHTPPIAVYSIGVGTGIDRSELLTIASRPETFSHLNNFSSASFTSVESSYSYQVCFTESQNVSFSDLQSGTLEKDASIRLRFTVPVTEGLTFRICIRRGRIVIYASTVPNPSSAQYGWRGEVTADSTCLTTFYDIQGESQNSQQRKKRQAESSESTLNFLYVSLEGKEELNIFSFNSSEGNITLDENECEQRPCDQNAECFNTDGSFFCVCSEGYLGNGTFCLEDSEYSEMPTETVGSPFGIILSIAIAAIMVLLGLIIVVATVVFSCHRRNSQKQQTMILDDKIHLTSNMEEPDVDEIEPYTPLELDVKMFSIQNKETVESKAVNTVVVTTDCERFVPKMVRKFEDLASDIAEADHKAKQRRPKQDKTRKALSSETEQECDEPGITRI